MTDPPGKSNAIARYGPAARVDAIRELSFEHSPRPLVKGIDFDMNDMGPGRSAGAIGPGNPRRSTYGLKLYTPYWP